MNRGLVLVTGASTGIGRATALELAASGFKVFAGVRRQEDAEALAQASPNLSPVFLDVTDEKQTEAVREAVEAEGQGLWGLVNNAGIALASPLEFLPSPILRQQLEVNLVGQLAVTQALLPLLRQAHGRIIHVGSIGGRVASPLLGPYSASKFALRALNDTWRRELKPWGIEVVLIEPGKIATPIWEKSVGAAEQLLAQLPREAFERYRVEVERSQRSVQRASKKGARASEVAAAVVHALSVPVPNARYLVGRDARVVALLSMLPERWLDWLMERRR